VPIGTHHGRVTLTDEVVEATIQTVLQPLPEPRVLMMASLHTISHPMRLLTVSLGREKVEFNLPEAGDVPIHTVHTNSGSADSPPQIHGYPKSVFYVGNTVTAHQIIFYLFNFHNFLTPSKRARSVFINSVDLQSADWTVEIRPRAESEAFRQCAASGGFLITHVARVYRTSGEVISEDAQKEILRCLLYFFSLARGFWCGPALPTGYDFSGKQICQRLESPRAVSCRGVASWFDRHHGNMLREVFPGFLQRWLDIRWRDSFERVIYWYLGSNEGSGGVEGSIILSQTALELLAWTILVEDDAVLSSDGFRKLTAADRIRLLMSRLPVSTLIPADLDELRSFATSRNASDGPQVLTSIRNALVHPGEAAKSRPSPRTLFQARDLAQWYVEIVLLWLCGHGGEYANRVRKERWLGQVERVPWAK
jgi:hypothetical protein